MMQYQFIFDSEPATAKVKGWDDIELKAAFDDQRLTVNASGELTVYDENIYNYINSKGPGETITLEIQFRSVATPAWTTLKTLSVPIIHMEMDCKQMAWKITFEGQSVLDKLKDKEREKVRYSLIGVTDTTLYQPWSGGELALTGGNFVDVFDVLETIINYFVPGATLNSNAIGAAAPVYQTAIYEINSIPAVSPGDTITLSVVNQFGDTLSVTVEALTGTGYTGAQLADVLAKALMHVKGVTSGNGPTLIMDVNELCGRVNEAYATSDTLTMVFDWEISSISFAINGSAAGSFNKVQSFQYSLKNLRIGNFGRNFLEISFGELMEALQLLMPMITEDSDSGLNIRPYKELNNTAPAITSENRYSKKSFNKNYIEEGLLVKHGYELSDYDNLQDSWQWTGTSADISSSITAAGLTTWMYTHLGATGSFRINGFVELTNTSSNFRTAWIDVYLNGTLLGKSGTEEIPPNGGVGRTAKIVVWIGVPEFCLVASDILTFTVVDSQGTQVSTTAGPHGLLLEGALCFDRPPVREDRPDNDSHQLINYIGLGSQKTLELPNDFYAGLGYLWSAMDQELVEPDDNQFHLALVDSSDEVELFQRKMYFEATDINACSCYQGVEVPFYFPNLILQPRYMLHNFRELPPGGIRTTAFLIETEVDASGVYSQTVTERAYDILKRHDRINKVEFEDVLTPEQFLSMLDLVTDVDLCDLTGTGIFKEFSLRLKPSGTTTILEV